MTRYSKIHLVVVLVTCFCTRLEGSNPNREAMLSQTEIIPYRLNYPKILCMGVGWNGINRLAESILKMKKFCITCVKETGR